MRPLRLASLVLILAALVAGIIYRSWVVAQYRAAVVLATTVDAPVGAFLARALTREPRFEDRDVGGVPTLVVTGPGDGRPLVLVNGATPRGRRHPTVRRLAEGLARTGFRVYVPDPPGLATGELTEATLDGVLAVARAAAAPAGRHMSGREQMSFVGVSVGTSLALAAAAELGPGRVRAVAGTAPYADLEDVIRIGTVGGFPAEAFLALVVGRSLAAAMEPGPARDRLLDRLLALDDDTPRPLDGLPAVDHPVARLLANRDPERFAALYAELPEAMRAGVRRLSPIHGAARVDAHVELAAPPRDKYFPLAHPKRLAAALPDARLTVTGTLEHAELRLGALPDIARLDAFAVRTLRAAR